LADPIEQKINFVIAYQFSEDFEPFN